MAELQKRTLSGSSGRVSRDDIADDQVAVQVPAMELQGDLMKLEPHRKKRLMRTTPLILGA